MIVKIAKQDIPMLSRFGAGGVVEIALWGAESVYWAVDHKHDLNRTTGIKSMIQANKRREQQVVLIDVRKPLMTLSPF